MLEGRLFDQRDGAEAAPVMIVSRELVRRLQIDRSPLGLHIETDMTMTPDEAKVRRVIGVVEDIPHFGPRSQAEAQIFVPQGQSAWHSMGLMLRTRLRTEEVSSATRSAVLELEPNAVLGEPISLRQALDTTLGQPRFYSRLLFLFAIAATFLACLGLYGLLGYSVASRRREIGIRAALGATPVSLITLVLRNGMALTLCGIGIGLLLTAAAVRLLQSMLFGVSAFDATTFGAAALLLFLFALAAALFPARRAAALDPVEALRGGQ